MTEQQSESGKYAFVFMWFFVTNRDSRPEESESENILDFIFDHRIYPDDVIIASENEMKNVINRIQGKENGSGVYA
jgi:deoxyadenosine/deoxycytidine kinase